jgi:hypothetical protein
VLLTPETIGQSDTNWLTAEIEFRVNDGYVELVLVETRDDWHPGAIKSRDIFPEVLS